METTNTCEKSTAGESYDQLEKQLIDASSFSTLNARQHAGKS